MSQSGFDIRQGYGLRCSALRSHRVGPTHYPHQGHRWILPGVQSGRIVKLTTKLRPVPRLKAIWDNLLHFHGRIYPITGLDRPLELQEAEAPKISNHSAHEDGKFASSLHRPPLPSRRYHSTDFCWRLSRSQGHNTAGRIKSMKNPNYPIGNRTRDLPSSNNCATAYPQIFVAWCLLKRKNNRIFMW
jgi:hypothetical protein